MNDLYSRSAQFLKRKSPTILTCVGAAGVVVTSISTAKAATKASKLLDLAKEEKGEELTKLEKVNVALPVYIPTILFGAATITCIFGANILNQKRQATLISAYGLLDRSYKEYKQKVDELYGEGTDEEVEEGIANDKFNEFDIKPRDGKQLFYDVFSRRYFESTMEELLIAEREVNRIMHTGWAVGVNEFYELLGLPGIVEYSELGWSTSMMEEAYWHAWIEFDHRHVTMEDGTECCIVDMPLEPFIDYID